MDLDPDLGGPKTDPVPQHCFQQLYKIWIAIFGMYTMCRKPSHATVLPKAAYAGQAASQWLELRLQLIGCGVVGGVALTAVIQHHVSGADPGMVGLAIR
jgi:hypothetical protein